MDQMEQQLAQLLANTQLPDEGPRKQAELDLSQAKANPDFPIAIARVGINPSFPVSIRQSALTYLRQFIEDNWSPDDGEAPRYPISDHYKHELREVLLALCLGSEGDRKVKVATSLVVSKIAQADFPDRWPTLLPSVLGVMPTGTDDQLHGALRILQDLVEESLTDEQFFGTAREIIKACYDVALNNDRKKNHRALAVVVFRSCFDLMDMAKDDHKKEVTSFAQEILAGWLPFMELVINSPLPDREEAGSQPQSWYGPITLKVQVVKTLIKIKTVFPSLLLPHSPTFFSAVWQELSRLRDAYQDLFINNEVQSRLEDSDGLPYTLDFLVLDELDFLNQCLRASPVQKHLEADIKAQPDMSKIDWVMKLNQLLVSYSQVTQEEEGLWDIDVSLFLAEETSVSANYTARTACGDVAVKLGEWLGPKVFQGLYEVAKTLFGNNTNNWREQEASLYLFNCALNDFLDCEKTVPVEVTAPYGEIIQYAVNRQDMPVLCARGFLAGAALSQAAGSPAYGLLEQTIKTVGSSDSELIQVACIKAMNGFLQSTLEPQYQGHILQAIQGYLSGLDLTSLEDSDDLLVTIVETLKAAIAVDMRTVLQPDSTALDMLLTLGKHGAANYHVEISVCEAFEEIAEAMKDATAYPAFCAKVLPSITGAFDVANVTGDDPLVILAVELLSILVEFGVEPLPAGFVEHTLPKLARLLMSSTEGEVLRPGTQAVKNMLMHDHQQVFAWSDESGRSGLEVCLMVIDRLLDPSMEDNAASDVGGLAAELVEKAGPQRLGPYLAQLLRAVAARLHTAQEVAIIQSLILVFARLSLTVEGARDVINFLSETPIDGQNGLQIVLSKWLENSAIFSGYDEIRQNIIALSKLYELNDARVNETLVKGDLIINNDTRIRTRSRAKQNPDQYTQIPAPLKIVKVLVDELGATAGFHSDARSAAMAQNVDVEEEDEDEDDEGWEDEPDVLDLGLGSTKAELMSWAEGNQALRDRDDETRHYLVGFFVRVATENIGNFNDRWYQHLNEEEKEKLRELSAQ
ncbi:ARM repeat-containing protein [Neurospora crassa]|uniref:KapG protein n=1 Tax=Neurospora crassa (strain ATCC 24698 / 74-OR23-1A / CBS 708.71 / DSM 1257 / FGSC 987) TaxID=367110 RepID=Q7S8N6_NEUCR|nr:KapG protein [Neurospora crassa OR74A]EAA32702.1 KapG protein [Neurospora crassa OR74A]KHE84043.1 ARM repeat-containing protein [Neurospora crassa]|eukprot:XP_961938.1 KapG protein [Neurospora crassa OR74A]